MKKTITLLLITLLLLGTFITTSVATILGSDIRVHIDRKEAPLTAATGLPALEAGRTLVPVRVITENMGFKVDWNGVLRKVDITGQGKHVSLVIDSNMAFSDGKVVTLDAPASIRNGRTYVPLRFISEAMGAHVEWDGTNRIVYITMDGSVTPTPTPIPQPQPQPGEGIPFQEAVKNPEVLSRTIVSGRLEPDAKVIAGTLPMAIPPDSANVQDMVFSVNVRGEKSDAILVVRFDKRINHFSNMLFLYFVKNGEIIGAAQSRGTVELSSGHFGYYFIDWRFKNEFRQADTVLMQFPKSDIIAVPMPNLDTLEYVPYQMKVQ